jgi:MSHA biogenesis protein MshG
MIWVIPTFAQVYQSFELELPLPTRIVIAAATMLREHGVLLLVAGVAAALLFRRWVATPAGRLWWDRLRLRFPVVGSILLRGTLARFGRAFAMASRSGVPLLAALAVVSRVVDNEHLAARIAGMREAIERGESFARSAAAAGVFTPLVLQMIAVGEESGQVEELIDEVADYYEREVDYDVRHLNDLIQPLLTVVLAGLVLLLALGVFLPMWDLTRIAGAG